ncbi:hypothetical protein GDO81_013076 [Engystomops pustulosus]|uniref:ATP-citrate synthase n=1 Tax=Engystomops pustulosus TaxID=76066 RepID=A0AAV7B119_ENGPU|nr:hypothetical protein GDO81_013076 [Engystomops pustulosus]
MSAKAISEQTGKEFLYKYICTSAAVQNRFKYAQVTYDTDWDRLVQDHPWLLTEPLVVKPDQLIKRRGKLGLVGVNLNLDQVKSWLKPRLGHETTIAKARGILKNFLIEPFVPHKQEEEFYVCIYAAREGDYVLFHHEGGVDVGDVDAKAQKLLVSVGERLTEQDVKNHLLIHVNPDKKEVLASFITGLFNLYDDLYFTYLEINPLVVTKDGVYVLDMAAKIDATADYLCKAKWGDVDFPPPFGREAYPEEAYIADLDAKSGASLKLTILNPNGRIWTMVAGGGASVVYSDTICDLGGVDELANYGEYSGAPSEQQTYDYAKTILSLMTREKHADGKILIIGGGIVRAIKDFQGPLKEHEVTIFVRRGGPNYQEGLRVMGEVGKTTGIPIHVFGTETHMTAIVGMALGHRPIPNQPPTAAHTANFLLNASGSSSTPAPSRTASFSESRQDEITPAKKPKPTIPSDTAAVHGPTKAKATTLFSRHTKAIVWGMQTRAVQGMLDFDYVCSRSEPSVAAMVYPFTGDHKQKFYWGHKEILIPVFKNMADAMRKHPEVDVLINFASLRSAYDSSMETMHYPQIRTIAIIAEGIPEALTRRLIKMADEKGVTIIGPATCCLCTRSGGMSNELNKHHSRTTDGVYEGVVQLVETEGRLPKPIVCWCIGTCATMFSSEVQFGHLGHGDRFGGALDAAAKICCKAFDSGLIPMEFVNKMKKEGKLIMGIGHRCQIMQILKTKRQATLPCYPPVRLCSGSGKITTSKKPNLILNVDGLIGVAFVDLLRNLKACENLFLSLQEEADEYIDIGALNGIFVLGKKHGFIGHYLDQKRLKQGLYRHPWDDISYVLPEHMTM